MEQVQLLTELFPVHSRLEKRRLYAYRARVTADDTYLLSMIGGKTAYRLGTYLSGEWVWIPEEGYILADVEVAENDLQTVLLRLWEQEELRFLDRIIPQGPHQPSPIALARYAERLVNKVLLQALRRYRTKTFGRVYVQRWAHARAWVVYERPAVSVTLSSRIYMQGVLTDYLPQLTPYLKRKRFAIWVLDRFGNLKGRLVQVLPEPLSYHRHRLLAYTEREEMKVYLERASDHEPVVRVKVGNRSYEYPSGALYLIPTFDLMTVLGVDAQKLQRYLRMTPQERTRILKDLVRQARDENLLERAYRSGQDHTRRFFQMGEHWQKQGRYRLVLRLRGGKEIPYDLSTIQRHHHIYREIKQRGLYQMHTRFAQGQAHLRLGVLDLLPQFPSDLKEDFLQRLEQELRSFGFGVDFVFDLSPEETSLARRVDWFQKDGVDLLLTFIPRKQHPIEEDDGEGLYHQIKRLTVGRGLPHQAVTEKGIRNPYAMANIVLGVLGKTGNVPYVLATPLPYADLVVGLDIARRQKQRLSGTINAAAVARIYFHDGRLLRYTLIQASSIEGETVPPEVLRQLFDLEEVQGKRVVIHRDGYFRGREKETLRSIARDLGATFYLVEVLKQGAPRMYRVVHRARGEEGRTFVQAPKRGDVFFLSDQEALVISSLASFQEGTPRPLRVRTERPFRIQDAVHSVLAMTVFHYGSLLPPRLPVTLHYSDRIAQLALDGIVPQHPEGDLPYWL